MASMTITEALAEIKTIEKRLVSKRDSVLLYVGHHDALHDPLDNKGGSKEFIQKERQAISDLEQRIVDIRAAVAKSNESTSITVLGKTRSVTEWLAWRKDVAGGAGGFLNSMRQKIAQLRIQHAASQRQYGVANANIGDQKPANIIVYLDEHELAQESEEFEQVIGQLDGQLSLKNATTQINLK